MTQIKYRTFDDLLDSVKSDLEIFNIENMIEPQSLIKVAKKINKELTQRIQVQKEDIIEISNGQARLPCDFHDINFAFALSSYIVESPTEIGTHTEERVLPNEDIENHDPCTVNLHCSGQSYQIVQKFSTECRTYQCKAPVYIINRGPDCSVLKSVNPERIEILIKGLWLYSNVDFCTIYINYTGSIDSNGTLMVVDHDIVNEYYEYALKKRIIENAIFAGEQLSDQFKIISNELRKAKIQALSINNMFEFDDLRDFKIALRRNQYNRYVRDIIE